MPNHFSDIGFDLNTEEEFRELACRVYEKGERLKTAKGTYICWSPGEGVELWGQLDSEDEIIGLNPHFSGQSTMSVGLTAEVDRTKDSVLDGAFHGWATPSDDNPESGHYPFVFDVPDFRLYKSVRIPGSAEVQLAAFAHELSAFESEEAYDSSQTEEAKFASESFIPSGLFSLDGEATRPPQAYAIMTGRVLDCATRRNSVTGNDFCWAMVQTYGGKFDIVADPLIVSGSIVTSGIVHGSFWLSGRLKSYADEQKPGFLRKLFG